MKKGKGIFTFIGLCLIALFVIGCASIIHGTKQDIGIFSSPTGADVTIDGKNFGKTPITAQLKRKSEHTVKVEMAGYAPFEATITKSVDGWFFGNILIGGIIGIVIDAMNGAMYKLSPEQINAQLSKSGMGYLYEKDKLFITVTMKPDPSWQKIGNLQPLN